MIDSQERARQTQTVCLVILTALGVAGALYFLRSVVVPFVLAVFFTFCLTPVITAQMRWLRLPRLAALVTTILLGGLILFLVGLVVAAAAGHLAERAEEYPDRTKELVHSVAERLNMERFGISTEESVESALDTLRRGAVGFLSATVDAVASVLQNGMLVLIFMMFMLMGKGTSLEARNPTLYEIEVQTRRYVAAMVLISVVLGALVGGTLAVLRVDFAFMFGFLAFLLNFIPNIGPVVATVLPLPVVMLSAKISITAKVLAIAIPGALQFVIGNYFQPKITGRSLQLHPVAVLLALIFFGLLWGIVGMFLATPIAAVLKILCEKLEYTRPVARVLAGDIGSHNRSAVTPPDRAGHSSVTGPPGFASPPYMARRRMTFVASSFNHTPPGGRLEQLWRPSQNNARPRPGRRAPLRNLGEPGRILLPGLINPASRVTIRPPPAPPPRTGTSARAARSDPRDAIAPPPGSARQPARSPPGCRRARTRSGAGPGPGGGYPPPGDGGC
jgi:AI-2 transport protein TqsA